MTYATVTDGVITSPLSLENLGSSEVQTDHEAIVDVQAIPGGAKSTVLANGDKSFYVDLVGVLVTAAQITQFETWLAAGTQLTVTTNMPSPYNSFSAKLQRTRYRERPGDMKYVATLRFVEV